MRRFNETQLACLLTVPGARNASDLRRSSYAIYRRVCDARSKDRPGQESRTGLLSSIGAYFSFFLPRAKDELPLFPPLSLEVGPLTTASGPGGALSSPVGSKADTRFGAYWSQKVQL